MAFPCFRRLAAVFLALAVAACGGGTGTTDMGSASDLGADAAARDATGADGGVVPDGGPVDASHGSDGSCTTDADGDGHVAIDCGGDDCNDTDPNDYPGNHEVCDAAGHDEDCNPATLGPDGDGDGFASTACCDTQPSGVVLCGSDCDDTRATVNPSAAESCNGIDDNCNGTVDEGVTFTCYADGDGDGYAAAAATSHTLCVCAAGSTPTAPGPGTTDCNDGNASVNPAASEVCNGIDDNCNGTADEGVTTTVYRDFDGDGFGDMSMTMAVCMLPTGYSATAGDCNDTSAAVHPGATEACNGIDDNCNGTVDEGCGCTPVGSTRMCGTSDGMGGLLMRGLCHPGMQTCGGASWGACSGNVAPTPETCNGLDDDCDGVVDNGVSRNCYRDNDGDGYAAAGAMIVSTGCTCPSLTTSVAPMGTNIDCDDTMMTVHPGAVEACDGLDDDCSSGGGSVPAEDADGDHHTAIGFAGCTGGSYPKDDCDDTNSDIFPGQSAWFTSPHTPSASVSAFDYDCDGAETFEYPSDSDYTCTNDFVSCTFTRGAMPGWCTAVHSAGNDNFCSGAQPYCGMGGAWADTPSCDVSCVPLRSSYRTQACH